MIKLPTFDNLFSPPRSSSSRVTTATTFSRQNEAIEKVVLVIESKGLRAGPAFVLLSEVERKEALSKSGDPIGVAEARTSDQSSNWFSVCERLFIDTPMAITKPAVPSAQLLGLGSKQFISNNYLMHNNKLTRFVRSLSPNTPKSRK